MTYEHLELVTNPKYPRSAKYDPVWIRENAMGSQCLWLVEALTADMDLRPGMRVLDMGAGRALGSIFLAKEYGVRVFANDLWVDATSNLARIKEAGVEDLVVPIHSEAHDLPYAEAYFDAIVTVNTLQFFATSEYYLPNHLTKLVRPGGLIGAVVPGLYREFEADVPTYLAPHWQSEFYSWHSAEWWRRHWARTGMVDVLLSDTFGPTEGHDIFRTWETVMGGAKLCHDDQGRNITFVRTIARRKE